MILQWDRHVDTDEIAITGGFGKFGENTDL